MKFTNETLVRSARTFVQSALAYVMVNAVYLNLSGDNLTLKSTLVGFFVSAIAAGLAGIMNLEEEENDI